MNAALPSTGRPVDVPLTVRPKRSPSNHFVPSTPRTLADPTLDRSTVYTDENTFIPSTISEHLLEQTYLDDVVRPLVRALVKARMTYGPLSQPGNEHAQIYADLDRLRGELQKSASRTRHAERERDDLARRLDLAGMPEPVYRETEIRERSDVRLQTTPFEHSMYPSRPSAAVSNTTSTLKRPLEVQSDTTKQDMDRRAETSSSTSHAQGPRPFTDLDSFDRPRGLNSPGRVTFEAHIPSNTFAGNSASQQRPYNDMPSDQDRGARFGPRVHLTNAAVEDQDYHPSYVYADGRDRWATSAHPGPPQRPSIARYSEHLGYSSSGSSSYLPTSASSERSPLPVLPTYSTTPSSGHSATPYHMYPQAELDKDADVDRARKVAKTRPSEQMSLRPPSPPRPGRSFASASQSYPITPASESAVNAVRKLAATKNRTCSHCSAPHDAKFRRGPNGPGTLCDRCGSRFKKFKEQEMNGNQTKREASEGSTSAHNASKTATRARLSSTSSSSQSPMDLPAANSGTKDARQDLQSLLPSTEPSSGNLAADESIDIPANGSVAITANGTSPGKEAQADPPANVQTQLSARRMQDNMAEEAMEE